MEIVLMGNKPLKPGELGGRKALLRSEKVAEDTAKQSLRGLKTEVTKQITKGDARGPGKHYKGLYN
jgi:hypothetical protein